MTENRRSVSITVWDTSADPPEQAGLVYLWNGFAEGDSVHSLLRYVEAHGEQLRRKYLACIHDLGETRIDGKRLIDHLAFEDGLSYWWMTLFVEKSFYKSPITDAVRLLALEEIVVRQRSGKLRLVSANRSLHEVLSGLCRNLDVDYEWKRLPDQALSQLNLRGIYRASPQPVQALIGLARHLLVRWRLRQTDKPGWFGGDRSLFFCSYFIHLNQEACTNGRFYSHHWEGLPKLLHDKGYRTNWIQHYLRSSVVPNTQVAMDWVRRFNQQRETQGFHTFLDSYLSWRIVLRVLKRWLKLTLISWRLGEIKNVFHTPGFQLSLWPLMRGDWYASMRGATAVSNLLWIELFDVVLRELPHQSKGLYLCENQAWERALIHTWRKHGHGQLIGVVHSTVRFWDLRQFSDPRTIQSSSGRCPMPQPDLTALNGKVAVDAYLAADYPKEAIVECEALRYGCLNSPRAGHSLTKAKEATIKVLILGDFVPSETIKMLQLLEAAVSLKPNLIACTAKPHPNFPIKAEDYPSLHLKVVMDPLSKIIHEFDIAYSSNATSAGVDAYIAGLPVVVMLNAMELNFSPLRGQPGVRFVSTPVELAEALHEADQSLDMNPVHDGYFFLDPALPRWQRLLSAASLT